MKPKKSYVSKPYFHLTTMFVCSLYFRNIIFRVTTDNLAHLFSRFLYVWQYLEFCLLEFWDLTKQKTIFNFITNQNVTQCQVDCYILHSFVIWFPFLTLIYYFFFFNSSCFFIVTFNVVIDTCCLLPSAPPAGQLRQLHSTHASNFSNFLQPK